MKIEDIEEQIDELDNEIHSIILQKIRLADKIERALEKRAKLTQENIKLIKAEVENKK